MVQIEDDADADEQVRTVFAYYGRAVYGASCLESGLINALMQVEFMAQTHGRARREGKAISRTDYEAQFDAYMARQQALTLGVLVARFRSVWRVGLELDALLDETLALRNTLAHPYFRDRAVDFAHSAGREGMIAELAAAHELFGRADEAVQASVAPILAKLGIDAERHRAEVDEIGRRAVAAAEARAPAEDTP